MKRLGVVVLLLAVAGCSSGGGDAATTPSASATSTPTVTSASPTPTPTPTPTQLRVGEEAVCLESFHHLEDATDLVVKWTSDGSGGGVVAADISAVIEPLEHAAAVAPVDMAPYYQVQIDTLNQMLDLATHGGSATIDYEDFKSAGLELVTRCAKYAN